MLRYEKTKEERRNKYYYIINRATDKTIALPMHKTSENRNNIAGVQPGRSDQTNLCGKEVEPPATTHILLKGSLARREVSLGFQLWRIGKHSFSKSFFLILLNSFHPLIQSFTFYIHLHLHHGRHLRCHYHLHHLYQYPTLLESHQLSLQ